MPSTVGGVEDLTDFQGKYRGEAKQWGGVQNGEKPKDRALAGKNVRIKNDEVRKHPTWWIQKLL